MPNILTITFSPSIDKSTSIPSLLPEKKLICEHPKLEPGGGGINVARAIKKLGGEAIAIYPAGGCNGIIFNQLLQNENISTLNIVSENNTKENLVVLDLSNNHQYRFGMPNVSLNDQEWKNCLKAVEEFENPEFIVASGSIPPGVPLNIFAKLAKIAKNKNAKFIIDTSGEALKQATDEGVYLIKPNLHELSKLAGKSELNSAEVEAAAKNIIAKGNCEVVVCSLGAEGAMLITKDVTRTILAPKVLSKSTVGAGDSMVGGIVYSLSKGESLEEAIKYGVACGSAATLNPGTELCKKEDADRLYQLLK
ncbi:MAG: 1-phosphofructokinase family hexose kinase [Bacteroidota bacterium]